MRFDELNEDNFILFAIKHYENPQAVTEDDFYDDMKRFKWIKRLLKKYKVNGEMNIHLLINHFLILYNIFGDAATPLLFFKIDAEYWSFIKTLIIYLGRFPEYPKTKLHDIPVDIDCLSHLNEL
jgi:hypothetical protein